ncbi:MAG: DUF1801 domain-containing protein [Gemmatimonadales bacterium]|nr:DUF1801 domain-containing protein [Gemmatimonadales bacterium]
MTPASTAAQLRAYFAALPPDARRATKRLRDIIRAAAPDAEEAYSYRIAAFKLDGRMLIWYAGWKEHTGMYPINAAKLRAAGGDPGEYVTSKGTVRFPLERPLPVGLIKRLIKGRVAEIRR